MFNDDIQKELDEGHKIWFSFCKKFGMEATGWKYKGWDFIKRVEKWAKKYPDVQIVMCDDYCATSSRIVIIPHNGYKKHLGSTIIFIPQNGRPAVDIGLNCHRVELINALKSVNRDRLPNL